MYVIIVGMLVLLCVSVCYILKAYQDGIRVPELPSAVQRRAYEDTLYDIRQYSTALVLGVVGLLWVVAYPLTYILACINAVVFKQYLYVKHVGIPAIKNYLKH